MATDGGKRGRQCILQNLGLQRVNSLGKGCESGSPPPAATSHHPMQRKPAMQSIEQRHTEVFF